MTKSIWLCMAPNMHEPISHTTQYTSNDSPFHGWLCSFALQSNLALCEVISGYFVVLARNCLTSTLEYIVMQKTNREYRAIPAQCVAQISSMSRDQRACYVTTIFNYWCEATVCISQRWTNTSRAIRSQFQIIKTDSAQSSSNKCKNKWFTKNLLTAH